jgi:hypothetical protein
MKVRLYAFVELEIPICLKYLSSLMIDYFIAFDWNKSEAKFL